MKALTPAPKSSRFAVSSAIKTAVMICLLFMMFTPAVYAAENTESVPSQGKTVVVWRPGEVEDVCMYHQFGTTTTKDGSVLVFAEGRIGRNDAGDPHHICEKRSTDGGKTWGETLLVADAWEDPCSDEENAEEGGKAGHCYTNPTPLVDEDTGRVFLFYAENFENKTTKVYYKYSDDEGISWSQAHEITSLFADDPYGRTFHLPGPGHGIQLQNSAQAGRLVVTVWHRMAYSLSYPYVPTQSDMEECRYGLSMLWSDDGGETWENSFITPKNNENEGRIAEMPDGMLVINARSIDAHRYRFVSTDAGRTWSESELWESIGSYGGCDSGYFSELKDGYTRLLTTHIAIDTTVRNSLWIYLSYDEGETWAYEKELWSDPELKSGTGASDITSISDGVYGIIHGTSWDTSQKVEFITISLRDLIGTDDETRVIHTHLGGNATCTQQAACAICGELYYGAHVYDDGCDSECNVCGSVRQPVHALESIQASEPTCKKTGHVAYYTCPLCGHMYADAEGKRELSKEAIELPRLEHQFVDHVCVFCGAREYDRLIRVCIACALLPLLAGLALYAGKQWRKG